MPKIGAHVSASGGVSNAPKNAYEEGCETFQFFVSSPQSYQFKEVAPTEIQNFKKNCRQYGFTQYFVHAPYLINLASADNRIRHSSVALLKKWLKASDQLEVTGMMFHIGSAKGYQNKKEAWPAVEKGIHQVLAGYTGKTKLLVENSAGSGQTIGAEFDGIGRLLAHFKNQDKIGMCLDTQHSFAVKYDWSTKKGATQALAELVKYIGLKKLAVIHANDSKPDFGSRHDRHEHIGKGKIGQTGFKILLNHSGLKKIPFILETPALGRAQDLELLKSLRK
ncbi:MAG: hypothetical protein A2233_01365 [Candidatus Kerfeldbacteria bacterium RIFOXYA2_FULL_38_24]|uniref:Probable endonuclease 4 n=1 Tax=Candidatus Kerfeldbacteria bacterium RIFOXYB2_FULL_38_14 TaxID=1798547 RepID=A0A1G2BDQ4_9BACT|nr:MAG: hypothetical protein A2233_01365 [Candidatus Kerfeldbacteria bacterium RIFOXYA2_FULL_38_24]OGY87383.1 MAG: hypothetical protein A2319_05455 [Candidatus Kerfeldbacteria bacterium RIFOXYB2_FULL_38_14]OGY90336.1 MAG: hypothetical protein A2458_04360 [Candidatus Kerfeldbacteria bacterium RIFOXYC2_FULL_38_9]